MKHIIVFLIVLIQSFTVAASDCDGSCANKNSVNANLPTLNILNQKEVKKAVSLSQGSETNAKTKKASAKWKYVVTIGQYMTKEEAVEAFKKALARKFNTELYYQKSLEVVKITEAGSLAPYFLVYSRFKSKDDAVKAYKLIKINDSEYSTSLFQE